MSFYGMKYSDLYFGFYTIWGFNTFILFLTLLQGINTLKVVGLCCYFITTIGMNLVARNFLKNGE